jgi:hypothetical protein
VKLLVLFGASCARLLLLVLLVVVVVVVLLFAVFSFALLISC